MIALTFDLETQNYKLNKRLASPFDERNYIVQAGWSVNGGKKHEQYYDTHHRTPVLPVDTLRQMGKGDVFIGFNIKFDLLWCWEEPELQAALKRGATIYCGQYAEYLLGGHVMEVQMCSMNDIAEQYGGGCKIDAVKEMWENGVLTADIPKDLLTDYLIGNNDGIVGDVQNTWLIYCGQIARMRDEHPPEFRTMLKFRMDGLLATCEMEFNGVYANTAVAEVLRKQLVIDLAVAEKELEQFIPELPPELLFNWGSSTHKSCLIFGGTAKYTKWTPHVDDKGNFIYKQIAEKHPLFNGVPIPTGECIKAGALYIREVVEGKGFPYNGKFYQAQDKYKSGKNANLGKFKNVTRPDSSNPDSRKGAQKDHYFTFDGYVSKVPAWQNKTTDAFGKPLYKTGAKIIEKLAKRGLEFTDALAKRTGMAKDLSTYYYTEDKNGVRKGMMTLPDEHGIIHHKLNHTSTVTSRLSSSDPNLQNVPRGNTSNVKQIFTSRFGEDGRQGEIDYSQLEVVIQGVLSEDEQLCLDLNNKIDFHCKRLAAKLDEPYTQVWQKCHLEECLDIEYTAMRTKAKIFSFQRAYGAGAETIAEETAMAVSEVKALIALEEKMYPGVVAFDKQLEATIHKNRVPTSFNIFIDGVAFKRGESHWDSPTGTRYIWRENITPTFMHAKGKYTGFSPTERKNYPVQGFGGEVVQTMLGLVFRYMLENDRFGGKVLLTNTVHDCVWLDGVDGVLQKVALEVQGILESVPEVFNNAYSTLNVTVPFPCETEIGKDLFTMKKLKG